MATRALGQSTTRKAVNVTFILSAAAATVVVVLKMAGVITWPWLWVLSPLWVSGLAVLACLLAVGVVLMFVSLALASSDWLRR